MRGRLSQLEFEQLGMFIPTLEVKPLEKKKQGIRKNIRCLGPALSGLATMKIVV